MTMMCFFMLYGWLAIAVLTLVSCVVDEPKLR
jgi:hypothetical protein